MGKCYRFTWNHSTKKFEYPDNWETVENQAVQETLLNIVQTIRSRSGINYCSNLTVGLILIALCITLSVASGFLIKEKSIWGAVLLVSMPFISFVGVCYQMSRSSPFVSINKYMEEHIRIFELITQEHHFHIQYLFWTASVSHSMEREESERGNEKTKIIEIKRPVKKRWFYCGKSYLEGYVEFLDSRDPSRRIDKKELSGKKVEVQPVSESQISILQPAKKPSKKARYNAATKSFKTPSKKKREFSNLKRPKKLNLNSEENIF